MGDVICNTSPLQYLHQVGQLSLLPALVQRVIVPQAVAEEIERGRAKGIDLPDLSVLAWVEIRRPASAPALASVTDLGPGETEVLALALESSDALVVLGAHQMRSMVENFAALRPSRRHKPFRYDR